MSNENQKTMTNPFEKTETLLEHNLMQRDKKANETTTLKEAEIMQRHQQHQEAQIVRESLIVLQHETNKNLDEIIKLLKELTIKKED